MADDSEKEPAQLDKKKLLIRIRERCSAMIEADEPNRREAKLDIKFVSLPGEQWDSKVKTARGDRPCYEFDKLSIKGQRLINEMRANRPAGKVRAVEDGDKGTASTMEGLCRNIANVSDLDTICDYAGVYQVEGGMGAWRVTTEYIPETLKKQRIRAEPIPNPFCLYWDECSTDPLKRDAADWCLIDEYSPSEFKRKWPKAEKISFEIGECQADAAWDNQEAIRVCEYWYKEPYEKELWLLNDGRTIDPAKEERRQPGSTQGLAAQVREKGMAQCDRIMMCIASGDAILEGPLEQAGRNHRFIVVHGAWKIIDGKPTWWGLVRKAKDAQRSYNVTRTAVTERIASAPNTQFWATAEQAKGHTDTWDRALTENLPYLLYNPDAKAGGAPPQRMQESPVPAALIAEMQMADQELKDVTGVYDAALGERSNEKSGVAITRREQQTQLVNFNFPDNMAKGVKRTWEIFVDLIPEIYDTEQMVRVLGADGAEDYVRVNSAGVDPNTGQPMIVNDLTRGEFDVTVTVGPSFATQRQEASETYSDLAQRDPALMAVAGDLVYKAMDLPYADEIAERRRAMLPPPIQQMLNQGKNVPPEVANAMAQVNQLSQQIQQQGQLIQQAAGEAEKMKAEAEKAIADLNVKRAQFDADVAKSLGNIAMQEAALATQQAGFTMKQAQDTAQQGEQQTTQMQSALSADVQNAITGIQELAAQYLEQATQTILQMPPKVIVTPPPPRQRVKRITRQNGALVPEYEDVAGDPGRVTHITRQNGDLVPVYENQPPTGMQ